MGHRAARGLLAITAILALSLVAGCGAQSPDEELLTALQPVASWAATAHMAADAWTRSDVPTTYAREALQEAQGELKSSTDMLQDVQPAKTAGKDGKSALEHARRASDLVDQMATSVDKGDKAAMKPKVDELAKEEEAINGFIEAAGGNQ